jgi:hypothetical protein
VDVLFITCRDWLTGAEPPVLLYQAGCRVDVLCPPRAWPTKNGLIRAAFPLPADPWRATESLRRHLETHRYAWIVFGDDPILEALAGRRDEPWLDGVLPIDRQAVDLEILGSKAGLVRACARHGWPAPRSAVVNSVEEARASTATLRYPLLLKLDRSSGGTGVFAIDSAAELDRRFPACARDVVMQERIDGPIWSAEALYDRGRLRACATSIMTRVWPAPFGASASRQYRSAPALEELVARAGAAIGAHGFANITAAWDARSGRFLLFELDLRVNATLRAASLAGVDFAAAVRAMLAGLPVIRTRVVSATVNLYPQDIIRRIEELDPLGLAAWLLGGARSLPRTDRRLERAYLRYIVARAARSVLPARLVELLTGPSLEEGKDAVPRRNQQFARPPPDPHEGLAALRER